MSFAIRKGKRVRAFMEDAYGRTIDYLRISITDRCNLRCKYCMPKGACLVSRREILTLEEIQAAAIAASSLGIRHIKVTGGEPLVRSGCCELIGRLKSIPGIEKVTLTTNGILLNRYLEALDQAGIDGINISLDTLEPKRYREITGRDGLEEVFSGMEKAILLGIPVKVNAVSIDWEGKREEWMALAGLAGRYPVDVRFIEMMPIGYGRDFKPFDHRELLRGLREAYPGLEDDERVHGPGPAVYYRIPGFKGSIGLISAMHGKFCGSCNRVRLTAQGYLKTCLCYEDGADLRKVLREGQEEFSDNGQEGKHWRWKYRDCPDDAGLQRRLRETIVQAVRQKPAMHCFEQPDKITESRFMAAIGG